MLTVKLTPAQRDAVMTYIAEDVHADDYPEAVLTGSILSLDCDYWRAADILMDAINSADCGDGEKPDAGSRKTLENVLTKLKKQRDAVKP